MSQWINLHALWQILVAGLICGAGLPALFVFGIRAMSWTPQGQPAAVGGDRIVGGNPVGIAIAGACFVARPSSVSAGGSTSSCPRGTSARPRRLIA